MASIYEQHRSAFDSVDAAVVVKDGARVATIAFKYGAAVTVYVHWVGLEMVRGRAGGGGYDRRTAACADAARKLAMDSGAYDDGTPHHSAEERASFDAFKAALQLDGGWGWDRALEDAGFTVFRAI